MSLFRSLQLDFTLLLVSRTTRIHYSDRYADDEHEYRHVILPKPLYKLIPKQCFVLDEKGKSTGILRLLSEDEWRGIGIKQSMGWVHYEVHGEFSSIFTSDTWQD